MRRPTKLIIKNNYPKNKSGNRLVFQVIKATIKYLNCKIDEHFFMTLTMMNDGWEYSPKRIAKDACLNEQQISNLKKDFIKRGLISVDNNEKTLTINYEKLSSEFKTDEPIIAKTINNKIETEKKFLESEELYARTYYPDCLGGGEINWNE